MEFTTAILASILVGGFALTYFTKLAFPSTWNSVLGRSKKTVSQSSVISQTDALETILLEGAGSTNIDMNFQKGTKINVKGQEYFIEGELHLTSSELVSDFSTLENEVDFLKNNTLEEDNLTGKKTTFSKSKPRAD